MFVILLVNRTSKGEYMAAAFPAVFAAGGVFLEHLLNRGYRRWALYVYPSLMIIMTIIIVPLVLPVLPVDQYIQYAKVLGHEPSSNENKELSDLPQFYADMFRWKEKAHDVAEVYNSLSTADKAKCAIFSINYGRCGAIDFYGKAYGLPASIGNHNNYWIWGPRDYTGEVMIIMGGSERRPHRRFRVDSAGKKIRVPALYAVREPRKYLGLQGVEEKSERDLARREALRIEQPFAIVLASSEAVVKQL